MMAQPRCTFECSGISKSFFGVPALQNVGLALHAGQTLGLVGENGAGKSTLMNILGGVIQPDAGRMIFDGDDYAPRDAREAAGRGIAFIHQELNLFPNLTIAENLHLPVFPRRRLAGIRLPLLDRRIMRRAAAELLQVVHLDHSPDTLVEDLSPGQRQLVEIAKAVRTRAKLVIFDEPTTSLTTREAEHLFALMEQLQASGTSLIYISHRLEDVLGICDDVLVLRDGQVVGGGPRNQFTEQSLISLMVGRSISQMFPKRSCASADQAALEVRSLTRRGVIENISFILRRGEVLGISGLMGAGRTELARALFGADPLDAGQILLQGRPHHPSPRSSIQCGLSFLTEDRRHEGLLMDAAISENMALVHLPRLSTIGLLRSSRMRDAIAHTSENVRLAGVATLRQPAKTLSGGNQQKVVLGKWLLASPRVFILDEPTRGIDVGAKHEIYKIINQLAESGGAVLLISSEIEELIGMCDRILVMAGGRIVDEIPAAEFERERILTAALGRPASPRASSPH